MADNDLLIKINADAKNAIKAFDDIRSETEDFEGALNDIAKFSGAAFLALTAEITLASVAFADADKTARNLSLTLQNQGIYSSALVKTYTDRAAALQKLTGIDDDAIIKGQAVLQNLIGQREISEETAKAALDLGEKLGSPIAGFEALGRAANGQGRELKQLGITIDESKTKSERLAEAVLKVSQKFGGLAEEGNKGLGGLRGLRSAFGDLQEEIGARFAPALSTGIKVLTEFFEKLKDKKGFADLVAGIVAGGAAATGLAAVAATMVTGLLAAGAAATVLGTTLAALAAPIALVVGGILAVGGAIAYFVKENLRLNGSVEGMNEQINAQTEAVKRLQERSKETIPELINPNVSKDLEEANKKLQELIATRDKLAQTQTETKDDEAAKQAKKNELAKAAAKKESEQAALKRAERAADNELLELELERASAATIALKQRELANLKELQATDDAERQDLLKEQREEIIALQDEQRAEDAERKAAFAIEEQAINDQLAQVGIDHNKAFREQDIADLQAKSASKQQIERQLALSIAADRIAAQNKEKEDIIKHGTFIATLNKVLNSDQVKATKELTSQLVSLQQSRFGILKTIGKAAAIANITINTAEGAVTVFNAAVKAFGVPVGPIVGAGLATAVVAYGAEQIGRVVSAQDGALVEGGTAGKDSVPFLLEPGELVVPKRNFAETVGAVQASRGQGGVGSDDMISTLKSIDEKLSQPHTTIINGDVLADSTYIDVLIEKINDRLRFGNSRLATDAA